MNADVLRVFADEGVSGRLESRPAFQAAVNFCMAERPHYFVTWSTSRFARDQGDAIAYKRKLAAVGTRVVYCGMEIDRDTNSGFLTEAMMEVMDEYQSGDRVGHSSLDGPQRRDGILQRRPPAGRLRTAASRR